MAPSDTPSTAPSDKPSVSPSADPSTSPSADPSTSPSVEPSASPAVSPSASPSASPSVAPSYNYRPSSGSNTKPSTAPSESTAPSDAPSESASPSDEPSASPSGSPSAAPDATPSAEPTDIVVTTVEELKTKAEAVDSETTITLQTEEKDAVIETASYSNVNLIVDSPEGHITNSATFKSITIKQISDETWVEKAEGNNITIAAATAHIELAEGAKPEEIKVTKPADSNAKPAITITVNGGSADKISVTAVVKLDIVKGEDSTEEESDAIPVEVTINDTTGIGEGEAVEVASAVKVEVAIKATVDLAVDVTFEETAEGSTIDASKTLANLAVSVDNQTKESVKVTMPDSEEKSVNANTKTEDPITVEPSAAERLNAIVAAITWDKISDEEQNSVTKNLKLLDIDGLGLGESVIKGAAIEWSVEPDDSDALTIDDTDTGKVGTVKQPEGEDAVDATVTLKATVTIEGLDNVEGNANVAEFEITIPAIQETPEIPENPSVEITGLADVTYSVAAGKLSDDDTENSGRNITIAKPTATVDGADADTATFEYGVSEDNKTEPAAEAFKEELDMLDSSKEYYLWVKVTVGEVTETFVSSKTLEISETSEDEEKSVSMEKFTTTEPEE